MLVSMCWLFLSHHPRLFSQHYSLIGCFCHAPSSSASSLSSTPSTSPSFFFSFLTPRLFSYSSSQRRKMRYTPSHTSERRKEKKRYISPKANWQRAIEQTKSCIWKRICHFLFLVLHFPSSAMLLILFRTNLNDSSSRYINWKQSSTRWSTSADRRRYRPTIHLVLQTAPSMQTRISSPHYSWVANVIAETRHGSSSAVRPRFPTRIS